MQPFPDLMSIFSSAMQPFPDQPCHGKMTENQTQIYMTGTFKISISQRIPLIAARWTQALMNLEEFSLCRCQGANHGVVWVVWYANDCSLGKQPKKRYPEKGVVVWFVYIYIYIYVSICVMIFSIFFCGGRLTHWFCYGCLRSPSAKAILDKPRRFSRHTSSVLQVQSDLSIVRLHPKTISKTYNII